MMYRASFLSESFFCPFQILVQLVFAISSLHLGRTKKCFQVSHTSGYTVSYFRMHYAKVLGLDYNEPSLPFSKTNGHLFDNLNQCGKPAVDGSTAIVNGHDAPVKAWPWQVLFLIQSPINKTSLCGGSLISESWVLTAAHCVTDGTRVTDGTLMLFLGVGDMSKLKVDLKRNDSGVQFRKAAKVIVHKGYTSHEADDIALVKLDKAATFDDYVQPVCLPEPGQSFENGEDGDCYATGWGSLGKTAGRATVLKQAKMNIMPQSLCIFTYSILGAKIDFRKLCLDLNDDVSGTCNGDSGGPLSCKVDGRFVLAGVSQAVAKRSNCTHTIFPAVDGRVTEYLEWIAINVRENEQ